MSEKAFAQLACWSLVKQLIDANTLHRSGVRLQEASDELILERLGGEYHELCDAVNPEQELEELADMFGIMLHLVHKRGYTLDDLDRAVVDKLSRRFVD